MNDETISAREAARRRMTLDGANAQALEGALAMTERERDAAIAARAESEAALGLMCEQWDELATQLHAVCSEVGSAWDALGPAWSKGQMSLAEAIKNKTAMLERLVDGDAQTLRDARLGAPCVPPMSSAVTCERCREGGRMTNQDVRNSERGDDQ